MYARDPVAPLKLGSIESPITAAGLNISEKNSMSIITADSSVATTSYTMPHSF